MRNSYSSFVTKILFKLLLAVPLGIAIHAFAFTPNTVKADGRPCFYCDVDNFCQVESFSLPQPGGHTCVDSGDGTWCNATLDCPPTE